MHTQPGEAGRDLKAARRDRTAVRHAPLPLPHSAAAPLRSCSRRAQAASKLMPRSISRLCCVVGRSVSGSTHSSCEGWGGRRGRQVRRGQAMGRRAGQRAAGETRGHAATAPLLLACGSPSRAMFWPGRSDTPSKYCTVRVVRRQHSGQGPQARAEQVTATPATRPSTHPGPHQPTLPSAFAARISAARVALK